MADSTYGLFGQNALPFVVAANKLERECAIIRYAVAVEALALLLNPRKKKKFVMDRATVSFVSI